MSDKTAAKKADRPNILMIYPDEMRADMMGCSGNPVIKTPYCDRLAQEGVRFQEAFSSFPLCTPFRASLFTGKYNHATGVHANHHPIPLGQSFLAEILKDHGYRTGYIGKWHLEGGDAPGFVPPGPRRLGFDHFVGFNRGHYYQNAIYYRDSDQPYHCPRFEPDFQTDHLLEFMEGCLSQGDGPFFGFICYGVPHFPFNMPDYLKNLYRPEEMPLGPSAGDAELQQQVSRQLLANNFPAASGVWGIGSGEAPKIESERTIREFMAKYYGMVANVDHNLGIILNWLDSKGLNQDTLVIFFSDHGDMCGEHGYRCGTKKTPYRQAAQAPFIIRYPRRFPSGLVVPSLVDVSVDTMPTILDLCGIPIPEEVQGTSLLSLLDGDPTPVREAVYYEVNKELEGPERFPIPERGVRTPDWLYTRTQQAPKLLYDLQNDPDELHNLVDDAKYKPEMDRLEKMLKIHMQRTGDDWSAESVFPPEGFLSHEEKTEKQKQLIARAVVEP
jgi:arylsulfatase A-like enzyme